MTDMNKPKIGIPEEIRLAHTPQSGKSYYCGCTPRSLHGMEGTPALIMRYQSYTPDEAGFLKLIADYWDNREPGTGRTDLNEVVVIHLPALFFVGRNVKVTFDHRLESGLTTRFKGEEPFIGNTVVEKRVVAETGERYNFVDDSGPVPVAYRWEDVEPDPCKFAWVVLYNVALLREQDKVGLNPEDEWAVVCIAASDVENEPMHPLTLVRNYLQKTGGTAMPLTLDQLAESVWYWKDRCPVRP